MIDINIKDSVYTLCTVYPELVEVLKAMGFTDISNPKMLNTVGRFMTLDKGAKLKNISIDHIKETLLENGFHLIISERRQ
jgi:hypothetical protein